jgi:hypothetical protein
LFARKKNPQVTSLRAITNKTKTASIT